MGQFSFALNMYLKKNRGAVKNRAINYLQKKRYVAFEFLENIYQETNLPLGNKCHLQLEAQSPD